jgi:hypothetical protein
MCESGRRDKLGTKESHVALVAITARPVCRGRILMGLGRNYCFAGNAQV